MVALSIQLVSITPFRLLYTTRGDGGPFYTAGIDYSIPI